jgi:hypothetical protein
MVTKNRQRIKRSGVENTGGETDCINGNKLHLAADWLFAPVEPQSLTHSLAYAKRAVAVYLVKPNL